MIEIEHRWNGAVLYTAKNAQDVRTALVEAVKSGANLYGANLYGADLSRADLSRANLSRADLSRANLSSADLPSADLSRANLYGANLYGANLSRADLSRANLYGANLYGANLYGANLSRADLSRADLSGANLYGANLYGADLYGADLYGADLSRAKGLNPYVTTPLHVLADQVGKVRAYKLVNENGEGPTKGGIVYRKGETVEVPDADCDPAVSCGRGINVATLDWCIRNWQRGYRILIVEFAAKDIAAIPHGSDGKFRVHRCRIVGEKDLKAVGVVA